jgi:hypothetical protein
VILSGNNVKFYNHFNPITGNNFLKSSFKFIDVGFLPKDGQLTKHF